MNVCVHGYVTIMKGILLSVAAVYVSGIGLFTHNMCILIRDASYC